MSLEVEFLGTRYPVPAEGWFTIGREADLVIDEANLYLHRCFLQVGQADGLWWIANAGDLLAATVADREGRVQAWLSPGAKLPVVFAHTVVRFAAGPTSYELEMHMSDEVFSEPVGVDGLTGAKTVGFRPLGTEQMLLVLALAESTLRGDGVGVIPSSPAAATRLGWTTKKFDRKLDQVCLKLSKVGVRGLRGGPADLATHRRSRLVEYVIATRLVTEDDLVLLDEMAPKKG